MERKVLGAQNISKNCIVCGVENRSGLHARFLELEGGDLLGTFVPTQDHQGYPGRLHGGIASALLDETMGRAINLTDPQAWGVTVELNLRYRKPVPLGASIRAIGRITKDSGRLFEGSGEIVLEDGGVAVEATGKFLRLPIDKIADADFDVTQWLTDEREVPASVDV